MKVVNPPSTFEEVMDKYADMVTRICLLRLGNEQDCKDAFQNVFLKLYMCKQEFATLEDVKAWLITVSIRQCIDESRKFWKRHTCEWTDIIGSITETKKDSVLANVMELPVHERSSLYLYYYEGYSVKEIAVFLHKKENTVKSWMRRGKERLRHQLGGENNET